MKDDDAIQIARQSGYGPIVKIPDDNLANPYGVIVVDLAAKPPTVTRIKDPHPQLRQRA